jgi:phosphoribosylglycinamide formyltransferase 1
VTYRVAVAVSGRGSNLQALVAGLEGTDASVVLVVSDREAPALAWAAERGIATQRLADWRDGAEWQSALAAAQVDLVVLAGFLKLVPPVVVAAYGGRMVNIHPALLPRHGGPGMYGARVHAAVLAAGDATSGATVHLVDEAYDRGAILAQAVVPVLAGDTTSTLAARVLDAEHRLLPAVVRAAAQAGHPVVLDPERSSAPRES